ncbi:hypothetical protein [Nocardioides sp. Leaf307]|uniref:hypothetical protein n=1 Tax=Nocardioides sp. Leaf307 TaxID=1736331 RepID=UPI0007025C74|nr:hypothetical protein [Nocardioides sp. Leaf307]KQQ43336.1 hypothetical protein ASF50_05095 [Nocardioides sp. Leaf307]
MADPTDFDAFYKDARARLLLQTYALTGDLAASRSAVRDAFVAAWHHWRKVSRSADPEAWVRPVAWSHALRRHTTRPFHKEKGLDPEAAATLEALAGLPLLQRRVLLLAHLASLSMTDLAREVGIPPADAERELQSATARFGLLRDLPTPLVRTALEPLAEVVAEARWPRPTIVRRTGAARRRTHTGVGAALVVGALLVTGTLVTDTAGVRPTLQRDAVAAPGDSVAPGAENPTDDTPTGSPTPEPEPLEAAALLGAEDVAARLPGGGWREGATTDGTEGDGLVLPCQGARYADPEGTVALVRAFRDRPRGQEAPRSAWQLAESSRTDRAARAAYDGAAGWFAGCDEPRAQLISTQRVDGVGDEAVLLVLRDWAAPTRTVVAGVARTGRIVTVTASQRRGTSADDLLDQARLLGGAVDGLCDLTDGGACTTRARLSPADALPVGEVPSLLSAVDLPPVGSVTRPWVGTEPERARDNDAATRCDQTSFVGDFRGARFNDSRTRTFLVPGGRLPTSFGLTQTVGSLPVPQARALVEQVRSRMASCADRDLGTDVVTVTSQTGPERSLDVWDVTVDVSDDTSVRFVVALLRRGTAVSQIGFVPGPDATMAGGAFLALAERAAERLAEQPAPRRAG